ncbi:MAG: STAS domain-containing protein [Gammaproteobacteria bacterium]|nr:STAS domain-containing protein [Gammaproteobacteria bacterium]MCP5444596.1 STAS domain-containing protein [Chromatiaceae bacterium]
MKESIVPPASVSMTSEGAILVAGDLVFSTVARLLEEARPMLAKVPNPIVDLESVVNCDSAGLVLLLELVAVAASTGQHVRFLNLPQSLLGIARLSNAEMLLPVAE